MSNDTHTFALDPAVLLGALTAADAPFSDMAHAAGLSDQQLLTAATSPGATLTRDALAALAQMLQLTPSTLLADPSELELPAALPAGMPGALQATYVPDQTHPSLALWGLVDVDDLRQTALDLGFDTVNEHDLPLWLPDGDGPELAVHDLPALLVPLAAAVRTLAWAGTSLPSDSMAAYATVARAVADAADDNARTGTPVFHDPPAHLLSVAAQPVAAAAHALAVPAPPGDMTRMAGPELITRFARDAWAQMFRHARFRYAGQPPAVRRPQPAQAEPEPRAVLRLHANERPDTQSARPFALELLVGPKATPTSLMTVAQARAHSLVRHTAQATRVVFALQPLETDDPFELDVNADRLASITAEQASAVILASDELGALDIAVDVPRELVRRPKVSVSFTMERDTSRPKIEAQAKLTANVALDGDPADETLTAALVRDDALVEVDGSWVLVDSRQRARLAAAVRTAAAAHPTGIRNVALALAGQLDTPQGVVQIDENDFTRELIATVRSIDLDAPPQLDQIERELRAHQQAGVSWLQQLADRGWGAMFNDDVGTGKTATLVALCASRPGPHLIVVPKSLVGTWQDEFTSFAPDVKVHVHYGPQRSSVLDSAPGTTVITTYETMLRDVDMIADIDFDVVALDEAARIKNPATLTAHAARRLKARCRVAVTATPVENSLSELWSLSQFANPGLLGALPAFRSSFARPIGEGDTERSELLARIMSPFQMQRTKEQTDMDVPAKHVHEVACALTSEQARLYETEQARIDDGFDDGIGRQGQVLALLGKLKRICNHPENEYRTGGRISGRSGKLQRCDELVDQALADGRKVLIFSQYVTMGRILTDHLSDRLELEVPLFHGGVSMTERATMVTAFQADDGPPVMVLSTQAGGTGLTLTAASVVIMYDRMWNPASEDQAAGRVWRFGQHRETDIFQLVTTGTLEERIVALLEHKRALAGAVRGKSASTLGHLTDAELKELTALVATANDEQFEQVAA